MTYKKSIIPLLDAVNRKIEQTQACNANRRTKEGKLHGHILYGEGFITGLKDKGHNVQGRNIPGIHRLEAQLRLILNFMEVLFQSSNNSK